jgi:hypothetical protein
MRHSLSQPGVLRAVEVILVAGNRSLTSRVASAAGRLRSNGPLGSNSTCLVSRVTGHLPLGRSTSAGDNLSNTPFDRTPIHTYPLCLMSFCCHLVCCLGACNAACRPAPMTGQRSSRT